MELNEILTSMIEASRLAGLEICSAFSKGHQMMIEHHTKSNSADIVTNTDILCQHIIEQFLLARHKFHKVIGEESVENSELSVEPTFIIDPIDGTSNFSRFIPHCAVLIAHAESKVVNVAVILDPFRGELFHAVLGKGAFMTKLNVVTLQAEGNASERILVNPNVKKLDRATVFVDLGYTRDGPGVDEYLRFQRNLLVKHHVRAPRVLGSCGIGLAWIACGRADVYVERNGPYIWDFAGGSLMIQEAGGVVMDPSGGPLNLSGRSILAANSKELALELIECLEGSKSIEIKSAL
jgi:fructose-1,6-bisphosphatase/inositol monophosphatase family enzyme